MSLMEKPNVIREVRAMLSVILIENGAGEKQLKKTIDQLATTQASQIIIATALPKIELGDVTVIYGKEEDLSSAITAATEKATNDKILFLDGALPFTATQINKLSEQANATSSAILYFPVHSADFAAEFAQNSVDALIPFISNENAWPVAAVVASKALLSKLVKSESATSKAILANAIAQAISEGEDVRQSSYVIELADATIARNATSLNTVESAAVLRHIAQNAYIEDLFPNYSWDTHGEESAALCYHIIAALFIRLGNVAFAEEALQLGDRFEDSPRALALRGMIAENQGQTLEGVARLVASLQQYEIRKRNDGRHLVTFMPRNVEKINESLQSGLEALNLRDNSKAINYFREAVFNFDSFYSDWGLKRE